MYLFNINTSVNLIFVFKIVSRTKLLVRRFFLFGQQKTADWNLHNTGSSFIRTHFQMRNIIDLSLPAAIILSPWPYRWCKSVFCLTFGLCIYFYLSNLKFRLLTIADSFLFIYFVVSSQILELGNVVNKWQQWGSKSVSQWRYQACGVACESSTLPTRSTEPKRKKWATRESAQPERKNKKKDKKEKELRIRAGWREIRSDQ